MADKKSVFNFDPLEALADIVTGDFLDFGTDSKEKADGDKKHVGDGSGHDANTVQTGASGDGSGKGKQPKRGTDEQLSDTFKSTGTAKKEGEAAGKQEQPKPADENKT